MAQKFYADPKTKFTHQNGAKSFGSGGPWAQHSFSKVQNCPIENVESLPGLRLTCYATGYPDTVFSIPACTRYKGKHVGGYFTSSDTGVVFRVLDRFKPLFNEVKA